MKHLTPTQAYFISFILLAMWAIFAYATMQNQIQEQERYAKLINISGKQRMLSQRTALLAIQYHQKPDVSYLKELKRCSSLMEEDHRYLTGNLPSENLRKIYFEKPYLLDAKVTSYFELLKGYINRSTPFNSEYLFEHSTQLLPDLDYAVQVYEQESDHKIARLTQIERYILLGTILTLILEALLILRPTFKKASLNMVQLQKMADGKTRKLALSLEKLESEIAAKERAEAALSRSHEVFEKLTNSAMDGIIQINHEGNIVFWNPAATEIFGYDAEEMRGANLHKILVPEEPRTLHLNAFPDFLKTGKGRAIGKTLELEATHKNGHIIPVELSLSSFLIGDNWQAMGVIRDITARKKAEQSRLEAESQLQQKYKMEAVGIMAGGMAHNFNNNLSIILGNLDLLNLQKNLTDKAQEFLNNAKIGVLRSRDLIQQLMAYSRAEEQKLVPTQFDAVIDETMNLLRATIPSTVYLQYNVTPESRGKTVLADATRIQEALLNLCNNAVHAMDESGQLTIGLETVILRSEDVSAEYNDCSPGNFLRLRIQDTGCGMTNEQLNKIFDPFYTTKKVGEGTGMGLSTVQGMVKQIGGQIKVLSILDQGTTFDLYIPVVGNQLPSLAEAKEQLLQQGTERILFVDDNKQVASLGKQLLTEMGYQVSMMTDSSEALKMFTANANCFDLVMTDQTMPKLTGKELIAEIKKVRTDIPTILCTGYSSKIDAHDAEELGISAFLMKPLDLSLLSQTIRQVLSQVSSRNL